MIVSEIEGADLDLFYSKNILYLNETVNLIFFCLLTKMHLLGFSSKKFYFVHYLRCALPSLLVSPFYITRNYILLTLINGDAIVAVYK